MDNATQSITIMLRPTLLFLIGVFSITALAATSTGAATLDDSCDETTMDEIECLSRVADRAAAQLRKDWSYLTKLAKTRNPHSIKYLTMGHLAFRSYVHKNCESEGHDALGGTLQEVLEQKCRRDTVLSRRRLFERIGEAHPLGRDAEVVFGRPICNSFEDASKPKAIGEATRLEDVTDLRKKLDEIGQRAARSGQYESGIAKLPRAANVAAEKMRSQDATYTCMGILQGFCPRVRDSKTEDAIKVRDEWVSRCQTEIHGAFYKRASTRLRMLKN